MRKTLAIAKEIRELLVEPVGFGASEAQIDARLIAAGASRIERYGTLTAVFYEDGREERRVVFTSHEEEDESGVLQPMGGK